MKPGWLFRRMLRHPKKSNDDNGDDDGGDDDNGYGGVLGSFVTALQ